MEGKLPSPTEPANAPEFAAAEPAQPISSPARPAPYADQKRTRLDFALAAGVCILALIFWLWDHKPIPGDVLPPPSPQLTTPQPSAADILNNQGTQLFRAGNYASAAILFRKAIAADPQGALGYCNLGAALIPQHKYDEAIALLQHALVLDPDLLLARNNLKWAQDEKAKQKP